MRKLFKERKVFKGGNYMRKYGTCYDNVYHFPVFYYQNLFTCAMSDGDRMLGKYEAAPFINVQ